MPGERNFNVDWHASKRERERANLHLPNVKSIDRKNGYPVSGCVCDVLQTPGMDKYSNVTCQLEISAQSLQLQPSSLFWLSLSVSQGESDPRGCVEVLLNPQDNGGANYGASTSLCSSQSPRKGQESCQIRRTTHGLEAAQRDKIRPPLPCS